MPEAISTQNVATLPITSQELGRGAFLPLPTKIGLSYSPTTIGLRNDSSKSKGSPFVRFVHFSFHLSKA